LSGCRERGGEENEIGTKEEEEELSLLLQYPPTSSSKEIEI
jgi:hypothetical protein